MNFSRALRHRLFWLNDAVRGGAVRKHLSDITELMTSSDSGLVDEQVRQRLEHILHHAQATTEFYRRVDVRSGLPGFPVIDKNTIRRNLSDFLSSTFQDHERIPAVTSGSTGTPFKVFHSKGKKQRNTADTIYFASLAGYTLGSKLYYFKIWSDYNKKSGLLQNMQNITPIDVLNLKANAERIIHKLNQNSSSVNFLGYVSAFETLCKYLDKSNTLSGKLKVNSIITMSESLNDYTKASAEKYFSCPVLSRYSNIENGIIAQQTIADKNLFVINRASYYVEILDEASDEPVPPGMPGRIVVTDYFNEVMPLIRYDTGDLGVMQEKVVGGILQFVFTRIDGRKLDQIYNTKGELISSYIVYKNMWKYTELEQYQFVQKDRRSYVFKVCIADTFEREQQLIDEFKVYLGADADFSVEYVKEIPLLKSGKRKKVVNEMNL